MASAQALGASHPATPPSLDLLINLSAAWVLPGPGVDLGTSRQGYCGTLLLYAPSQRPFSRSQLASDLRGAMGIRTPDLLHAMPGESVWPRRTGSDTARSSE